MGIQHDMRTFILAVGPYRHRMVFRHRSACYTVSLDSGLLRRSYRFSIPNDSKSNKDSTVRRCQNMLLAAPTLMTRLVWAYGIVRY
jgi:hypothetical protein